MIAKVSVNIAKCERSAMVRASDDAYAQGVGRNLVSPEDLSSVDFLLAIETHQAHPNRAAGWWHWARRHAPGFHNSTNDFAISSAATQDSTNRVYYVGFGGRGIALEECCRGDQHARSAGAALGGSMSQKRALQAIVDGRARGETFDGGDLASSNLSGSYQAGANRIVVDEHGASAAIAGVAADFCSGQAKIVAQHP